MIGSKKERSAAIQQSLLNGGNLYPLSFFDTRKYIQHNVTISDGIDAIFQFMDELPADNRSVRVCRAIEDGDFSIVHNDYRLGNLGTMAAFEVHRWENGKIVEHWDNLQTMPAAPNPSGRSMVDGDTRVVDHERTADNKRIIECFTHEILIELQSDSIAAYFQGDALIQHNPSLGDGVGMFRQYLQTVGERRLAMAHCRFCSTIFRSRSFRLSALERSSRYRLR
jgi:predicted SnoaL-like aldol condensation-catalyzing enzyme